jgi:uncharacterized protein (TIGR02271 family)
MATPNSPSPVETGSDRAAGSDREPATVVVPLVAESVVLDKETVAVGALRVRLETERASERVAVDLASEEWQPTVRPVGKPAAERLDPYRDGDEIVVPVYEERVVFERRLFLKEEVRLRHVQRVEHREDDVAVRRQHAVFERQQADGSWRRVAIDPGAPLAEPVSSSTGSNAVE